MKITKAITSVAGFGTRVLPVSKSISEEMLPIMGKPVIQHIVEETVHSGITDTLIITNRGKGPIKDHFDRVPELEAHLAKDGANKEAVLNSIVEISRLANIYSVRQKETRGLRYTVNCTRSFIGSEPLAVLYGDDVIIGKDPVCGQLIRAYGEFGKSVLGMNEVSSEVIGRYSSLKVEPTRDRLFRCTDMIEKPSPDKVFPYYSILGRCVLPPETFDIPDRTPSGSGGEVQLTDAMCVLAQTVGMTAVEFTGKCYGMGNKFGILQATVEVALEHPEIEEGFRKYIKEIADTL